MLTIVDLIKKHPKLVLVRLKNLFLELDAVHFRRLMLNIAAEVTG